MNGLDVSSFISARLFSELRAYVLEMIQMFGYAAMGRMTLFALTVGATLLTVWFMVQGYRIATGLHRDSMLQFLLRAVMVVTVMALAQGMSVFGQSMAQWLTEDMRNSIAGLLTGETFQDASEMVGTVLGYMLMLQLALDTFQASGATGQSSLSMANTLNFITGAGQALPALIAGGLMLLNEMALHLCLAFAPLCLLAYTFVPTRFMFVAWCKFTVTTLFSMVVITVVSVIALRAMIAMSVTLLTMDLGVSALHEVQGLQGGAALQLREVATISGGVGMLLTTLLLAGPPLVANFFSGQVSAAFHSFNAIGSFSKDSASAPIASAQDYKHQSNGVRRVENSDVKVKSLDG